MLMEQQTVTNPAVIHDLSAMTKHGVHGLASTTDQQCMLAQARPTMRIILLVVPRTFVVMIVSAVGLVLLCGSCVCAYVVFGIPG